MAKSTKPTLLDFTTEGPFAPRMLTTFVGIRRTTTVNLLALEFDVLLSEGQGTARLVIPILLADLNRLHDTLRTGAAAGNPGGAETPTKPTEVN